MFSIFKASSLSNPNLLRSPSLPYISSIGYLNGKTMEEIYGSDGENKRYKVLSEDALKMLNLSRASTLFKRTFLGGNK